MAITRIIGEGLGLARYLDATLLKADARLADIQNLCTRALDYRCAAVCVNPLWIEEAARLLEGSSVKVATVVGFPLGALTSRQKLTELGHSMQAGAEELDFVINLSWVKDANWQQLKAELQQAAGLAHQGQAVFKVIMETGLLTSEEIVRVAQLALEAEADFLKTSTGFGPRGVSVEDILLIRETVGTAARIKASGGIKTLAFTRRLLDAGADRIGTSNFEEIIREEMAEITG
ncbi:MAG: deoxyribose-phosphate aldolase [Methanomassiliicoccales archaeon]